MAEGPARAGRPRLFGQFPAPAPRPPTPSGSPLPIIMYHPSSVGTSSGDGLMRGGAASRASPVPRRARHHRPIAAPARSSALPIVTRAFLRIETGAIDVRGAQHLVGGLVGRRPGRSCACRRKLQHRRVRRLRRHVRRPHRHDAWVHVDGAFGLWAAASPAIAPPGGRCRAPPTRGHAMGTSGSTSPRLRLRLLRAPERPRRVDASRRRLSRRPGGGARPQSVRLRARIVTPGTGFALRGRRCRARQDGVAELVDRCCRFARRSRRNWPAATAWRS